MYYILNPNKVICGPGYSQKEKAIREAEDKILDTSTSWYRTFYIIESDRLGEDKFCTDGNHLIDGNLILKISLRGGNYGRHA